MGGLKGGLFRVVYQVDTDDEVAIPERAPTAKQTMTEAAILIIIVLLLAILL
ncbi:conserved hypothetical protein [Imperialibacter sp. EC-SDR9]|nr:conserved hypothetical protein [Imperialibacter sp. 75]CAD5279966.1 conserved hypothetical protein [Imperialibacter sp. 89]VVT01165.1 conserved hypothetical protein [Imperialibacter sp. EC-SDR9]